MSTSFTTALSQEQRFPLQESCILLGYVGSIAHETYIPKEEASGIDDKDLMGIAIPPKEYFYGLHNYEQTEIRPRKTNEWDIVIYDIRKMFRLLLKNNPNVLSILFLKPSHYLIKDSLGEKIIQNRDLFLSKQVYHSFCGYARAQATKMERWEFKGYMGEKRKSLVEKFGYDCKNAQHLIRILRQGIELLVEGKMYVNRGNKDAAELIAIKKGEWSLHDVKKEADKLFKLAEEAYVKSSLPNSPNDNAINKLLIEIVEEKLLTF